MATYRILSDVEIHFVAKTWNTLYTGGSTNVESIRKRMLDVYLDTSYLLQISRIGELFSCKPLRNLVPVYEGSISTGES